MMEGTSAGMERIEPGACVREPLCCIEDQMGGLSERASEGIS